MKRLAACLFALSCAASSAWAQVPEVRIARQYSMGYLQFNVLEHDKLIQKHAAALGIPEVKVSSFRFNGPTAMNDALLSDSVDIVGGSPHGMFTLWAKSRGTPMEVRAISALVTLPVEITSTDPAIRTLRDLDKCKKIPVPSLRVSMPAILIQQAAVKEYGLKEFARYDNQMITMSPADATVAMLSGNAEINCTVALPPFMQQQLESGKVHSIANSFDLFGGKATYTVAYTSAKFRDRDPKLYPALSNAMKEATETVRTDIEKASRYWIEDSGSKLTVDFVAKAGSGKGTEWTMIPDRTMDAAAFMADIGTLKVRPKSWKDYFFPEAYELPGS